MEDKKLIIGRNPVREYLKTSPGRASARLYISEGAHGKIISDLISEARRIGLEVIKKPPEFFHKIDSSSRHQGVALELAGSARSPETSPSDLLDTAAANRGVLVALDQITDPHNAGSIIRSAEALGASGVVWTKAHSPGVTPTVVKSSAGATAHIKILTVSNIASFLDQAKERGFWIVGTSDRGTTDLSKLAEYRPAVVIVGSEGEGMRHLTADKCDVIAAIPLKGTISSLNAGVAAGIVLYEILKDKQT